MGFVAQGARICSTPPCGVPMSMPRLPGEMKGSRCQRPFPRRAIVAEALRKTGSGDARERMYIPGLSKGIRALLASGAATLASALVAASPAAATLGPADVLQLQDTLNEVWGERLSLTIK